MENTNDVNINNEENMTEETQNMDKNEKKNSGTMVRVLKVAGKYLLKCLKAGGKAAAIAGGGTAATIAVLKALEPKKKYIDVPGSKAPQVDAEEGVDFVSVPKEEPSDE